MSISSLYGKACSRKIEGQEISDDQGTRWDHEDFDYEEDSDSDYEIMTLTMTVLFFLLINRVRVETQTAKLMKPFHTKQLPEIAMTIDTQSRMFTCVVNLCSSALWGRRWHKSWASWLELWAWAKWTRTNSTSLRKTTRETAPWPKRSGWCLTHCDIVRLVTWPGHSLMGLGFDFDRHYWSR